MERRLQLEQVLRVAHVRQSWPESGLGFRVEVLKTFPVVPPLLESGNLISLMERRLQLEQVRSRMAYVRQSQPDFGLGFQANLLKTCQVVPSVLESGNLRTRRAR
jgi:hypothetical protein